VILFEFGYSIFSPCEKENPVYLKFTTLVFIVVSPDVLGGVGPILLSQPFIKMISKNKISNIECFIFE
jgi:hypothetical protein